MLGNGENFKNLKRLSRQARVLLKSPIPGTELPPEQGPELVRRGMQWQCYVCSLLYSYGGYYFENLLTGLQKQSSKSLTPEILRKNHFRQKRVEFNLQPEIFD